MIENPITRVWHDYDRKTIYILRKDDITRSYPATWHNCARTWQAVQRALQSDGDRGVFARGVYYARMFRYYRPGQTWKFEYVTLALLPTLDLQITLTDAGRELIAELESDGEGFQRIDGELFEDVQANGFTFDWNGWERSTLTLESIADDGEIDYQPGSLCWSHDNYALRFWWEETAPILFRPYYLGDWSTDQQGSLSLYY